MKPTMRKKQPASRLERIKQLLKRGAIVEGIGLAVLLAVGLSYVAAADRDIKAFQKRLAEAPSAAFVGSLNYRGDSFLSTFDSDLGFYGNYSRTTADGFELHGFYKGTLAAREYDGQAVVDHGDLYFMMDGPDLPALRYKQSSFTYRVKNAAWHKHKLDKSLIDNYCETRPDDRYPDGLAFYRTIRALKMNNSLLVNFLGNIDGQRATHYSGSVDTDTMPKALETLNAVWPAGCPVTYFESDFKAVSIDYDLWTSPDRDRFKLTFRDRELGITFYFTVDLFDYGNPADITLPEGASSAIDMNAMRQKQAELLARDYTRKSNLEDLQAAIEAYSRERNGALPVSLNSLRPKYLLTIPRDPGTGQSYNYSYSRDGSYTLTARLEEPDAGLYTIAGP